MTATTRSLPTNRQEAWRWADLAALEAARASVRGGAAVDAAAWFLDLAGDRLVFVDGVFQPELSAPGRVQVEPVRIATPHPLASGMGGPGWTLTLGDGAVEAPVQIVHVATGGENHVPARIVLARDAAASVVETYVGQGWSNRLTRIELAHGARLMRSVRIDQDAGYVSLRDEAEVGEGARLVSIFLAAGGASSRVDGRIEVTGTAGFAEMGGALLARGEQQQEAAVVVRHDALDGTSRQTWRAVAADQSAASLAARVEVARGAQQTDGEQSLRGLLMQRSATVNLKPELEIFADDVKCAHGATVGELDRHAIFYLESRGIPAGRARAMLTRAFVADAIERIGDEVVREAFIADADRWLEALA